MSSRDRYIAIGVYLVAFAIIAVYDFTHPMINDILVEYQNYLLNLAHGWHIRNILPVGLVNSCLLSTYIPVILHKMGISAYAAFRILPVFFYALMPMFVYLIGRRYLNVRYSLVAVAALIFNPYIFYYPDIGRVGVALGLLAGLVWALLNKKTLFFVVFAVLLPFAHYGTSLFAIVILFAVAVIQVIIHKKIPYNYVLPLVILIALVGVWDFGINKQVGVTINNSVVQSVVGVDSVSAGSGNVSVDVISNPIRGILDFQNRDTVTQLAFGLGWLKLTLLYKIEWFFDWLIVGIITLGLLNVVKRRMFDRDYRLMAVIAYLVILASIALPYVSRNYGVERVYFTMYVLLACCFPIGVKWIANKIKMSGVALSAVVLIPYAFVVSDWAHNIFVK